MEDKIVYAPILIPTLCRDEHLIRCVESLKRNGWARYTDVYIAVDYPKNDSHWTGYKKICDYLEGDFPEFASFHVVKRTENQGPSKNMRMLLEDIVQKYDRYIRTDDDVEFSPNFIEYVDKGLMYYENDDDVIGVTGYSFPVGWCATQGSTVIKERIVAPVWGIGFWVKKRQIFVDEIEGGGLFDIFEKGHRRHMFKGMTDTCVRDYRNAYASGLYTKSGLFRVTDLTLAMYLGAKNKYVVSPIVSKARNWGFDGTGVSCVDVSAQTKNARSYTYPYAQQPIDEEMHFELIESQELYLEENLKRYNEFDRRTKWEKWKPQLKLMCLRLFGRKLFIRLGRKIHERH